MSRAFEIIVQVILVVFVAGFFGWFGWRLLKNTDDPRRLILKWVTTAIMLLLLFGVVGPMVAKAIDEENRGMAFILVGMMAGIGLVLTVVWRHDIGGLIAKPFESLYSGGDEQLEPKPLYSAAVSKRNRGKFAEAIAHIREQLNRFPDDVEGHMLLAEILVENMNDLQGAEITVHRLCAQPGHMPRSIAYALNTLADWQMKYGQDPDSARATLEKITELLPETEFAALALQRIAHIADKEQMVARLDPKRFAVPEGVQNMGLIDPAEHPKPAEVEQTEVARELIGHLTVHPMDTDARERLALIYSDFYGRLDLASEQLELMIALPDQPAKRTVRWLNLLADIQVRHSIDYDTVKATVLRVVERFPNTAFAHAANSRIDHLRLEFKGKEKTSTVRLGSYEQDIGLKGRLPNQF